MENKYVCSVDIGGTKIATAIMEYPADGSVPRPVFEAEVPTEAQEGGEAVFQRIEASIKAALEANPDVEVLGVGIGAAGVVDPKTGAIAYANEIMPGWSGVQLGPRLREDLGLPVAVVGDVQAHALGEAHWGVGKGKFSVLCLGIGTGIGGAVIAHGRLVRGKASMVLPVIWATLSVRLPPAFPAPAGVPAIWSRLLRALPLVECTMSVLAASTPAVLRSVAM